MWQPIYRRLVCLLVCLGLLWVPGAATGVRAAPPMIYSLAKAQTITSEESTSVQESNEQLATARLRGVVTDEVGRPADQVSVYAEYVSLDGTQSASFFGDTGPKGTYILEGLPLGKYRLLFSPSSFSPLSSYRSVYYDQALTARTAKWVEVRQGGTIDHINARLVHHAGSLQGHVTDEQGQPIAGISVAVYEDFDHDGQWEPFLDAFEQVSAATDATGNYQIADLPDGAYRLWFSSPSEVIGRSSCDNYRYFGEYYPDSTTIDTAQTVTIKKGKPITDLNAQLTEIASIRGRVTNGDGAPIPGITVSTYFTATDNLLKCRGTTTDAAGFYHLGVPAGTHRISFVTYYRHPMTPSSLPIYAGYTPENYGGTDSRAEFTPIQVQDREKISGIDAVLEPAGAFIGKVTDQNNVGLSQIKVTAYSDLDSNDLWDSISTDLSSSTGDYIVPNLPSGTYRLEFQDTRQPPLFHTKMFSTDGSNLFVYPEQAENLGLLDGGDHGRQIVYPAVTQLVPFSAINAPPWARDDSMLVFSTTVTNTLASDYSVLANDRDAEQDNLTAVLASNPANGTVSLAPSGFFTYTPTSGTLISDSFTYNASDGQNKSRETVVMIVGSGATRNFLPLAAR